MRKISGVFALIVVVSLTQSTCNRAGVGQSITSNRYATIMISKPGNDCVVVTSPAVLVADDDDIVNWAVFDYSPNGVCTQTDEVEIRWKPGSNEPFNPACAAKKFKDKLDCKIKKGEKGSRKYDVYLGGVEKEDPEIQIEMP